MTAPRRITQEELLAEGAKRFGPDPLDIRFACPGCGDVAAVREFPEGAFSRAGQECIGRSVEGRGCDRAAYGLIPGPWTVVLPDGREIRSFPLADAPEGES